METRLVKENIPVCPTIGAYGGEKIKDAIASLSSILQQVPEEFRDSAEIEIEASEYSLDIELYYYRPETKMETLQREQRARNDLDLEARQLRERAELLEQRRAMLGEPP